MFWGTLLLIMVFVVVFFSFFLAQTCVDVRSVPLQSFGGRGGVSSTLTTSNPFHVSPPHRLNTEDSRVTPEDSRVMPLTRRLSAPALKKTTKDELSTRGVASTWAMR